MTQDIILGFEYQWHVKKLLRKFKHLTDLNNKVHILLDFAEVEGDKEVPDPINFEPDEYWEVMERIEKGVDRSLKKIIEINNE